MRHARWAVVLVALLSLALAGPAGAVKPGTGGGGGGGTTTPHDPILFVHGWNSSGSTWNTMVSRFQADGWTSPQLNNWSYNTAQSNATTAAQIRDKVDGILAATGATKVDLVTHSMGGLSSRYYVKNLGGDLKVDEWVSLGGPNHGTDTANFCFDTSCGEMRIGSTFLTNLNSGDETPGTVNYGTWWSACDSVINPDSSVSLSGATNRQTACLSHSALTTDATVYAQVRDFVR
jgi:triacylglycerol lipase